MYLDSESHLTLLEQCKKLIEFSETHERWSKSSYGAFLRMSSDYTLSELRRHWGLYCAMKDLPLDRLEQIRSTFMEQSKPSTNLRLVLSSGRAAGPLMLREVVTFSEHFIQYWKTGITSSSSADIDAATLLNPTFVYSLAGEGCNVHYSSDPLVSFHLASVIGNANSPITIFQLVKAAKAEFSDWCSTYRTSVAAASTNPPIVRFFAAEATAASRSLHAMAVTGTLKLNIAVDQWKTQLMELSRDEYIARQAPSIFNIVDTSNLDDHIGPLNVLTASIPLLLSHPSCVLYTESLVTIEEDATKEFVKHLHANIPSLALVIGLCPVSYLCGFTSRSNTHELLVRRVVKEDHVSQFHEVTTWKVPESGDTLVAEHLSRNGSWCIAFDSRQLATFLYELYHSLFEQDDTMTYLTRNESNIQKALEASNLVHYVRESFVLFLKLVRDRRHISDQQWTEIMYYFFDFLYADNSIPMHQQHYHDFYAQLHRHGLYTVKDYLSPLSKTGRVVNWSNVPPIVRIILTVPREELHVLEHGPMNEIGTPPLQVVVCGKHSRHIFSSVHAAWGRSISMGTNAHPWAMFEEDPEGRSGRSPLVVSFVMSTGLLTGIYEPPETLTIELSLRSTVGTLMHFVTHFGPTLTIYSAQLMDASKVIVLPEDPLPSKKILSTPPSSPLDISFQIGPASSVTINFDEQCELVASMTSRISVHNKDAQRLFQSVRVRATPEISQISSCMMRIKLGRHQQDVCFPFPVIGSQNHVKLARASLYIEVEVPPAGPLKPDGMKLNLFPVTRYNGILSPWNIHRINLCRLPVLDVEAAELAKWLNPHVGSMMSTRDSRLRKKHEGGALTLIKDSLHTIMVRSAGIQKGPPRRLFSLYDVATHKCDTVFFISDLRYDLSSHTVVCDGYVLSTKPEIMESMAPAFDRLVAEGNPVCVSAYEGELRAWKQLLPALVERCRSWKHTENCEYASQGQIPLSVELEEVPLCSCGRGKDTEGMFKDALWRPLAPYVTRIALSPLFAVSYLDSIVPRS
ncbi:hypothetical protein EWM64_g6862, partial [Hericium alpestre]